MKYLKKFNESIDNNLWEKITYETFLNYVGGGVESRKFDRLVEFNENDTDLISKVKGGFNFYLRDNYTRHDLGSLNEIVMWGNSDMVNLDWFKNVGAYPPPFNILITILKNDDDFYLVSITDIFLCDTIYGVISLFKEVMKNYETPNISEGLFDFFKKKPVRQLPTDILYEPLSTNEYYLFLKSHESINFNKEELSYLSSISKYSKPRIVGGGKTFHIQLMNNSFLVYKFDDEWYLIEHTKYEEVGSKNNSTVDEYGNDYYYYKCDTFDGVRQFFYKS